MFKEKKTYMAQGGDLTGHGKIPTIPKRSNKTDVLSGFLKTMLIEKSF